MLTPKLHHLVDLLKSGKISNENTDRCIRVCYDASKVIHLRQKRLGKPRLKMPEIASALSLVHFHHVNLYHFDVIGELTANLRDCDETKALNYYETKMIGKVTDKFGKSVLIDEDGMRTLYKDHATGKHIVASENYEESRGKRLPWIIHVLKNSPSVYVVDEMLYGKHFRRTRVYTGLASIPVKGDHKGSYFVVIVSEDGNKRLKFVTAYGIDGFNRFLACIEPGVPTGET